MNNLLNQIASLKTQLEALEQEVIKLQPNPKLEVLEKEFEVRTGYVVLVDPTQKDENLLKYLVLHKSFIKVAALHAWVEYDKQPNEELRVNTIHYNLILDNGSVVKNARILRVGASEEEVWEGAKMSWLSMGPSHTKVYF